MICPDCNQKAVEMTLTHDDTCPLGKGQDEQLTSDREWFDRHPFAPYRRRPPHWSEVQWLRMARVIPETGEVHGQIVVSPVAPGVRTKRFDGLWIKAVS